MNNINNTLRAGLTLVAGLAAMYSCTDTWDEHYSDFAANENSYAGTLMQAIEDEAPDFAKVVKAYGYDRELGSDNFYTVWAPVDGSFNLSDYVDEAGNRVADSTEVVKQFLKSHISRYAYSLGKNDQKFTLLNEKTITLFADGKFGDTQIDKKNISTNNGVLYTIAKPNPYAFNLFEIIAREYKADQTEGKDTMSLYSYLYDPKVNKDSLIEEKSVYRGMDENGEKIWVDSFLLRNNTILKNVDATVYEEDSNFIAIIPSVKAWQERYRIAERLLNFNPSEDTRTPGTCDSLKRHYANQFAMSDLFFNKNANEHWQDSLMSTIHRTGAWYNHKYYSKMPKDMPEDKFINDILAKAGTPEECSNGDAYLVDEYPMGVDEQFFYRLKVSGRYGINDDLDNKGTGKFTKNVNTAFKTTNGTYSYKWRDQQQKTYKYSFVNIEPSSGSANPIVGFDVDNNLSGLYDIYLVTCPIWMATPPTGDLTPEVIELQDTRPYRFYVNVFERDDKGEYPNSGVRLKNPNIDAVDVEGKQLYNTNYFITHGGSIFKNPDDPTELAINDTLYIGEYEFKNAYYGRNDNGVVIQLQVQITSKQTKEYSRQMLISSLILKPRGYKNDDGEVVLFPHAYQKPAADESGEGTEDKPAESAAKAMRFSNVINKNEK